MRDLHHLPPMGATSSGSTSLDGAAAESAPTAYAPRVALRSDGLSRSTPSPCRHGVLRPAPT
jgi:hypothetical protein